MNKTQRTKVIATIKDAHVTYLSSIAASPHAAALQPRFLNLARKLRAFVRKQDGSLNAVKAIPNLSRVLFGLAEDLNRLGLPGYPFAHETKIVNDGAIAALEVRRRSNYSGECASYGESLLNCYLDVFVTFTVLNTPKDIGAKPTFLVNPVTGSVLELDILLEDFRLAFEFQGEHHYMDPKVQAKDAFKLARCGALQRILIPVNISQLQRAELETLIVNSMKDFLGLHEVLLNGDPSKLPIGAASAKQLVGFSKATQRIFLAETIFRPTLDWLDAHASTYVANAITRSPVSATTAAPRQTPPTPQLPLGQVYGGLRHITSIRKRP